MRSQFVRPLMLVGLLLAAPTSSSAQTISLTESQALEQLALDNPRVRAVNAPVDVARAGVLAARRWPNPRFTYDRESVAGVTENLTMVGQMLPVTGRRTFEADAASALVEAASGLASQQVRRLRADLRLAFADLVAAQQRERELTVVRDRLQELAGVLARREAAGEAAGFDRLRAEREVLELDVDRAGAASDRLRAQATLAGFLMPPASSATITAVAPMPGRGVPPPVSELMTMAAQSRGDMAALRHEIDAASFSERAAERSRIPEPEVVGGTKSSNIGSGGVGSVFLLHVPIPLFDRARPERAAARARRSQAEAQLESLRTTLRSQITVWRDALIERRATADRYRATAGPAAAELERIAQVSYDAGERGILELLDAYHSAATARIRQGALDAAVRQAEIELEFLSGWENP